ncbi:uncharacterized protein B0H64DRAFT_369672 [Chaetomium fimeti]|uniref:Uncharacterized protein n=1 Tax=Chaetomium fimeti TaxID=1854472 RepID=A0AAE0HPT5_9PEZI|nr:hypothetical protein B0H64DRAFT_369672 [Chaetomium fimeti]
MSAPAMASRTLPTALPVLPATYSSDHVEPVFLNVSTAEEVIECIINAHDNVGTGDWGSLPLLSFHWDDASRVDDLSDRLFVRLRELDRPKIHRFEYDYESKTVFLKISESEFRYQVQMGLRDYLRKYTGFPPFMEKLVVTASDEIFRDSLEAIEDWGWVTIEYGNKLYKQADVSFGKIVRMPKACQYIDMSDGKIRVAMILDLQYPDMKKGWVSLRVADDSSSYWAKQSELFYDEDLAQQPVGQVGLYLSDFLGPAGLRPAFCRPSASELAAGITRDPAIPLPYEKLQAIFRRSRYISNPKEFTMEPGDEEENIYLYMNRLAEIRNEVRIETDRCVTELRAEKHRRFDAIHVEKMRRMDEICDDMSRRFGIRVQQRFAEADNEALGKARSEAERSEAEARTMALIKSDMAEEFAELDRQKKQILDETKPQIREACEEEKRRIEQELDEMDHRMMPAEIERRMAEQRHWLYGIFKRIQRVWNA